MGNCLDRSSSLFSTHDMTSSIASSIPFLDNIAQRYELGPTLGRGRFGFVRRCTEHTSHASFACKSIAKSNQFDMEEVQCEVDIMRSLADHPNIARIHSVFQDKAHVHLVMELCEGGELFDQIVKRIAHPEQEAAIIVKQLAEVIQFCHERGIMHRDLKPENILLSTADPSSEIKLADFGLALRFSKGQKFRGKAGSAYYIAPEILHGEYSEEIDIWSIGVILYILLCGFPPFGGETEDEIFEDICKGNIDFDSNPWRNKISWEAKDLVRKMLTPSVEKRITPTEILKHSWILRHNTTYQPTKKPDIVNETRLDTSFSFCANATIMGCASPRVPPVTCSITNHDKIIGLIGSSAIDALIDPHVQLTAKCSTNPVEEDQALNTNYSTSSSLSSKSSSPSEEDGMISRWMSFCHTVGPDSEELMSSIVPDIKCSSDPKEVSHSLGEDKGGYSCNYTVLRSNSKMESLIVNSKGRRFFVAIDRKRKRFGWKHLEEES